jgi:hypothetical protein
MRFSIIYMKRLILAILSMASLPTTYPSNGYCFPFAKASLFMAVPEKHWAGVLLSLENQF